MPVMSARGMVPRGPTGVAYDTDAAILSGPSRGGSASGRVSAASGPALRRASMIANVPHDPIVSFAQNREDVVLWRALGGVTAGRYVEIGANHPTTFSLSLIHI